MKSKCRHCKRRTINRPRFLCAVCFNTPEVRELYPAKRQFYRPRQPEPACQGQPREATSAIPGSEEKIRVLTQRASAGLSLWHPDDAR